MDKQFEHRTRNERLTVEGARRDGFMAIIFKRMMHQHGMKEGAKEKPDKTVCACVSERVRFFPTIY